MSKKRESGRRGSFQKGQPAEAAVFHGQLAGLQLKKLQTVTVRLAQWSTFRAHGVRKTCVLETQVFFAH